MKTPLSIAKRCLLASAASLLLALPTLAASASYRPLGIDTNTGALDGLPTGATVTNWTQVGTGGSGSSAFATNSAYATNSGYASSSGYSTNSGTATSATTAGSATYAASSGYSTNAGTAASATSATTATYASSSGYSTNAGTATSATSASTATYSTSSGYSTNAGTATTATSATSASSATVAATATNALQLGGTNAASYETTSGSYTITGARTFSGPMDASAAGTASNSLYLGGMAAASYPTQATGNITVVLTNSMTTAQWQSAIDALPKEGNGKNVTFNIGAGTMNLTAPLTFTGMRYNALLVHGANQSQTLNSNQTSVLSFAAGQHGLRFINCYGQIYVRYLKISCVTTSDVYCVYNSGSVYVYPQYNWITGNSTTSGKGVYAYGGGICMTYLNYFSNMQMAHYANQCAQIWTSGNGTTGTTSTYGHYSKALIYRSDTNAVGTTDNAGHAILLSTGSWY